MTNTHLSVGVIVSVKVLPPVLEIESSTEKVSENTLVIPLIILSVMSTVSKNILVIPLAKLSL